MKIVNPLYKSKVNFSDQLYNLLFLIIIFFSIFMNYNGNSHSEYVNIWSFLDGNFQNDLYEKNSLFTKTSIFYPILNFLGINLQYDIQGILFHYTVSIFAGYYFFKIIKKFLDIQSTQIVLLVILTLSIFDNVLLETTKSGWIVQHTLVPSHLALCFSFYYLWQILNKNKFNLIFSTIFLLLISIKVAWFLIFCATIFIYFDRRKFLDLYWLIPCIFFVLYLLINFSDQGIDNETKLNLFNEVIRREGNEVALHLQSKWKLLITTISFFIYYYFIKFVKNKNFNKFSRYVLILSFCLFIVGGLYIKFGQFIYPDPKLAMLTPVRSMYIYQLFFGILFCNFIIIKFKQNKMLYVLLVAPFFLSYGIKGLILYTVVIFSLHLISYFKFSNKISFPSLVVLLLLFLVLNSSINRFKKYDHFTFEKLNHWSTLMPDNTEFKNFFVNIRYCSDFMIYDELNFNRQANFFSNKSRYFHKNSVISGLNYSVYEETKRREAILKIIKEKKNISSSHKSRISKENFLYVSKENINSNFFTIKKNFGNLIFIFDETNLKNLKKNCKKLMYK